MHLRIALPRFWWFYAVFFSAMTVLLCGVSIFFLVVIVSGRYGPIVVEPVFLSLAFAYATSAVLSWGIARSTPELIVETDQLILNHPGVLRSPIYVLRADVHSIYVQSIRRKDRKRPITGTLLVPDLSFTRNKDPLNLLVVFNSPIPIGLTTRWGFGFLRFVLHGGVGYVLTGPSRSTMARGMLARIDDEEMALQSFIGWPQAVQPQDDLVGWLGLPNLISTGPAGPNS